MILSTVARYFKRSAVDSMHDSGQHRARGRGRHRWFRYGVRRGPSCGRHRAIARRSTARRHRDRCAAPVAGFRDPPEEFRAIAESPGLLAEHILKLAATGPAVGVDATTHPENGDVIEALTRVADEVAADVIVVGNQRPALMPTFIAASIADRLIRHARCDVLVVNTDSAAA